MRKTRGLTNIDGKTSLYKTRGLTNIDGKTSLYKNFLLLTPLKRIGKLSAPHFSHHLTNILVQDKTQNNI